MGMDGCLLMTVEKFMVKVAEGERPAGEVT
jgi:hypothetical protein